VFFFGTAARERREAQSKDNRTTPFRVRSVSSVIIENPAGSGSRAREQGLQSLAATISVPLAHFTGFAELPPRAFKNLELMGDGYGIYFPAIDEYISVENLFVQPSELRYSRIPAKLIDRRPRPVHTPAR